jgi:type II secretion system protein N
MRLLKKRNLWFTLYGIAITALFFYMLFPSELVRQRIEDTARSFAWELKAASVSPSLPFGLMLKDVSLSTPQSDGQPWFRGEALDIQPGLWSFLSSRKSLRFSGMAYGGKFDGRIRLSSFSQKRPPEEGRLKFSNMDISRMSIPGVAFLNGFSGLIRGDVSYDFTQPTDPFPQGAVSVYLEKGSYPLPEPFLGISRIEIERGEIQGAVKNGVLKLDKIEMYGMQLNCFLSGDIRLTDDLMKSVLNLKGSLEIVGQSKLKMNVTVGGTLASPSFRYI